MRATEKDSTGECGTLAGDAIRAEVAEWQTLTA